MITIEQHQGIHVLRDDLLPGGTKSILLPHMVTDEYNEYVYASPVYGGFQIALSIYCQSVGKKATIFCAKRKARHENTFVCELYGANIIEVSPGYLSVIEKRATDYCAKYNAKKLAFGAHSLANEALIAQRMREVIKVLGKEPDEVWCAVGSGLLIDGIIDGTNNARIFGVCVGKEYTFEGYYENRNRIELIKHPFDFGKRANAVAPFPSMPHYDLKAWEKCVTWPRIPGKTVLFWNVL